MREKGFTLVELLVALAVSSVIVVSTGQIIHSILVTNVRGNGQVVALTDINRAVLAIRNDLLMAQSTDLVDGVPKSSANLTWFDYTSSFGTSFGTDHSASYSLVGRELRRNYDGVESIVGRQVISISFTQSVTSTGKAATVSISTGNTTLSPGVETMIFSVHLRPEEIE
ncbi:MAG: prepilin-type N-terminal cleavage/methylation domain-containing protein [Chloroflexota bacterium]